MGYGIELDEAQERLFLAGARVRAGRYRPVGRRSGDVVLEEDGVLPASLDGRVACYVRLDFTWSQIAGRQASGASVAAAA